MNSRVVVDQCPVDTYIDISDIYQPISYIIDTIDTIMVDEKSILEQSWPSCRWAIDISGWNPSDDEFNFLCKHLITVSEETHCKRFKFLDDRKRALVSILLQRLVGALLLLKSQEQGLNTGTTTTCSKTGDPREITIGKTKGRKPYIDTTKAPFEGMDCANFNYNVSHDGKYVVLAAETQCVCGCDVSSTQSLFKKKGMNASVSLEELKTYFTAFEKQLTKKEWEKVYGASPGDDDTRQICDRFCTYWSLKEAFAKAIGTGLGYDLSQVEFEVDDDTGTAFVRIHPDTDVSSEWCMYMHQIADGHWVAVARGPPHAIIDAHGGFTTTFTSLVLSKDVLNAHVFQKREPPFVHMNAQDLIRIYCSRCGSTESSGTTLGAEYLERFCST